jgi:5-methylcytosine-specific restriction endonuclease McrA
MAKRGRPKAVITDQQIDELERLNVSLPRHQIADFLGIHEKTLAKCARENQKLSAVLSKTTSLNGRTKHNPTFLLSAKAITKRTKKLDRLRKSNEKNKEIINKTALAIYYSNKDKWIERVRNWQQENPEKVRAYDAKKRARRANAEGWYSGIDVERQYKAQRGRCLWCKKIVGHNYHVDHIIPIAKGGSNWPSNICVSCPSCNLTKSAKMPEQFAGVLL